VPGIQVVTVRGKNLLAGSTVACSDSSIVLKPVEWKGSWLQTRVNVPVGAAPGHVDLIVTASDGSMSILTAGLEITPADPVVTTVTPGLGPKAGGSSMTLHGAGFRPGARVVVGDQIYVDGQPGGCTVVDETTISLITRATAPGTHDAVVIDATGVEGRAPDAFTSAAVPVLSGLFPPSGALDGGTSLVLNGVDFAPGIVVRIGGVAQTGVVFDSPLRVRLTTGAATLPGPYDLEIENPGGAQAQGVFVYWDQPDPALDAIAPESGDPAGGETVTLHGANFTPTTAVVFGADPDTGEGGLPAPSVVFVDSETLVVVTPAFGAGSAAVLVQDEDTGQGSVAPQAFEFVSRGGGGGGGGCGSLAPPAPPTWRDALAGTWLLAALFAWLALRAARARPRHARA
jgi:hypothetical protein